MDATMKLYGHPIIPSGILSLEEQVHDALCEEIHTGRWDIEERLPGVLTLSRMSGVSTGVIQRALETLRAEGYLQQEMRKGTFLKSMLPDNRKPLGAIGIVMALVEEQTSDAVMTQRLLRYQHRLIEAITRRNYVTEIIYIRPDEDLSQIDTAGVRFSDRVRGIVSLYPFPRPDYRELPPNKIPLVYQYYTYRKKNVQCAPFIGSEPSFGYYEITKRLIDMGHRNILFCCDKEYFPENIPLHFLGHQKAMEEAGLSVNIEAKERSWDLPNAGHACLRSFLEDFSDATAIVCTSGRLAQSFIALADEMGIKVPQDLSVAGSDHGFPTGQAIESIRKLTRVVHDIDLVIETGLNVLFEMMKTRHNYYADIHIKSRVKEGDTLAPPPSGKKKSRKEKEGALKISG